MLEIEGDFEELQVNLVDQIKKAHEGFIANAEIVLKSMNKVSQVN